MQSVGSLVTRLHARPREFVRLLPTGTCSNEALHAEMRAWFRNVHSAHLASFRSRLCVFKQAKVPTHHAAAHDPTVRQEPQDVMLARICGGRRLWTESGWREFCSEQDRLGRFRIYGKSQPSLEFRENQRELRDWKARGSEVVPPVRKRPARAVGFDLPVGAPSGKARRTVFSRERVVRVVRPTRPLDP